MNKKGRPANGTLINAVEVWFVLGACLACQMFSLSAEASIFVTEGGYSFIIISKIESEVENKKWEAKKKKNG